MSRSRILNRIHRTIRRQLASTVPEHAFMTRREALKLGGLALGGIALGSLALPKRGWASAASSAPRIGIVGAGISGLTAALTLHDSGVGCSIYEASTRIGGRMHSDATFWNQGQVSEWCGEFIDTDHYLIRALAKRFGLTLLDVNAADPKGSVDTNYFLGAYYTDLQLAEDTKAIAPIVNQQVRDIGPVVQYNQYTEAGYYFDHISAYDWIETYVPGGHSSQLGRYLDLGVVTLNGLDSSQQSSLNLIVPFFSDERFHTQGGNDQIPFAIASALPAGTMNLGWRLSAVAANSDKTVTLTFSTPSGTEQVTFDYVILTLPFSVLRNLDLTQAGFDALKMTSINQLGYGTNSKLILQFDQRYWNGHGAWPGISDGFIETDLLFQSTWDSSRAELGSNGLLTDYTGGTPGAAYKPDGPYTTSASSAKTAQYAQAFLAQLEQVWPGGTARYLGLANLSYPTGDPNLLGSYSAYKVGQITGFAGYEGVPQGSIFFGGEQCSIDFQGYMEGGAEEGRRAALQVLSAVG
jgi:monoamine oxidase